MIPNLEIKNETVREYYDFLERVYLNESVPKKDRVEVAKRMEAIQNLVLIYEYSDEMSFEDITWTEIGDPVLPEDRRKLKDGLLKYIVPIE